ncbi:MAG: hypothetical protein ACLTW9_18515 [Enterocloster sp.]
MNYGVLNGYAGAMLQPAYARRFRGYGEDSLGVSRVLLSWKTA